MHGQTAKACRRTRLAPLRLGRGRRAPPACPGPLRAGRAATARPTARTSFTATAAVVARLVLGECRPANKRRAARARAYSDDVAVQRRRRGSRARRAGSSAGTSGARRRTPGANAASATHAGRADLMPVGEPRTRAAGGRGPVFTPRTPRAARRLGVQRERHRQRSSAGRPRGASGGRTPRPPRGASPTAARACGSARAAPREAARRATTSTPSHHPRP
jgi:hypothetical protein